MSDWESEQRGVDALVQALSDEEVRILVHELLAVQVAALEHATRFADPGVRRRVRDALPAWALATFDRGTPFIPGAVPARMQLIFLARDLQLAGRIQNGLPVVTLP